ncbi:hypothetical protein [Desulfurivibrio sp. C05AmB]|uniref:hypothetical protein n=1 Tax=Desulfurivibrio sp. C05AmB TaxID=3374371 RepID=UPI00376F367A
MIAELSKELAKGFTYHHCEAQQNGDEALVMACTAEGDVLATLTVPGSGHDLEALERYYHAVCRSVRPK